MANSKTSSPLDKMIIAYGNITTQYNSHTKILCCCFYINIYVCTQIPPRHTCIEFIYTKRRIKFKFFFMVLLVKLVHVCIVFIYFNFFKRIIRTDQMIREVLYFLLHSCTVKLFIETNFHFPAIVTKAKNSNK